MLSKTLHHLKKKQHDYFIFLTGKPETVIITRTGQESTTPSSGGGSRRSTPSSEETGVEGNAI